MNSDTSAPSTRLHSIAVGALWGASIGALLATIAADWRAARRQQLLDEWNEGRIAGMRAGVRAYEQGRRSAVPGRTAE